MTKMPSLLDKDHATSTVSISLLGRFVLQASAVVVDDSANRSHKMWNILAYLIMHRDKTISQQEFIDMLWAEEDMRNPGNALKTLLYRIRMLLAPLQETLGAELILSRRGAYSWNPQLSCQLDTETFEALYHKANETALSEEERIQLYFQAVNLYRGDFLPKLTLEFWVIPFYSYYHTLYLAAVKELAALLALHSRYREMEDICSRAIQIDNLDETLHCLLIQALIGSGQDAAALAHYETATDLLYRHLGIKPSEELRALYVEIMKVRKNMEMDLSTIQSQLKEAEAIPGAFVCEYGFFKEAYRLEARRIIRSGTAVYIALVTVTTRLGEIPELDLLNATMDQLLIVIQSSLRKGDVISRYSGAQYVLMLQALTYEDGEMVMNRILNNFYKYYKRHFLKLHFKLQQMDISQD